MPAGLQYLTANENIAYPFKENSSGLAYGVPYKHGTENATIPLDFIIDAVINLPQGYDSICLKSIIPVGTKYRFEFTNNDAAVIFTYDLEPVTLTDTYAIIDMGSSVSRILIRLLVNAAFVQYLDEITTGNIYGKALPFDTSVITPISKRVQQFDLASIPPGLLHTIASNVKFKDGYNVQLSIIGKDIDTDTTTIKIDASPGIGLGLNPCLDEGKQSVPLGLIPDESGNINIIGDDCTNIIPHIDTTGKTVKFEIQSDCVECCTCEDYLNSAKSLKKLIDRTDKVRTDLLAFHATFTDAINNYNIKKAAASAIVIGVAGSLGSGGSATRGNILVFGANRSAKEDLQITNITIIAPATLDYTNFTPTTLSPQIGTSFYFVYQAAGPLPSWNVDVTVEYVFNGETKTISKSVVIT